MYHLQMNLTPTPLRMRPDDYLNVEDFHPTGSSPMLSPSMSETTPSSTTPTHLPVRRPSRKSTLTQQQKNQKRQRATQDQLTTLEVEFARNPTPNAAVREKIAQEINMTERSVQIWFQNKLVGVLDNAHADADEWTDAPRSKPLPRRVMKLAKSVISFQTPCANILLCKLWDLESPF